MEGYYGVQRLWFKMNVIKKRMVIALLMLVLFMIGCSSGNEVGSVFIQKTGHAGTLSSAAKGSGGTGEELCKACTHKMENGVCVETGNEWDDGCSPRSSKQFLEKYADKNCQDYYNECWSLNKKACKKHGQFYCVLQKDKGKIGIDTPLVLPGEACYWTDCCIRPHDDKPDEVLWCRQGGVNPNVVQDDPSDNDKPKCDHSYDNNYACGIAAGYRDGKLIVDWYNKPYPPNCKTTADLACDKKCNSKHRVGYKCHTNSGYTEFPPPGVTPKGMVVVRGVDCKCFDAT